MSQPPLSATAPDAVPLQPVAPSDYKLDHQPVASGIPDETKNISSNEIEEQEVASIAKELKQGLHDQTSAAAAPDKHLEAGDTIFIDQEGNMTMAPSEPQADDSGDDSSNPKSS